MRKKIIKRVLVNLAVGATIGEDSLDLRSADKTFVSARQYNSNQKGVSIQLETTGSTLQDAMHIDHFSGKFDSLTDPALDISDFNGGEIIVKIKTEGRAVEAGEDGLIEVVFQTVVENGQNC